RQIDDDPGKESRFRQAEDKSRGIELPRRVYRSHEDGHQSPTDQNARDPFARAPPLCDQRAGNFENKIADEKDAGAQSEDAVAEGEVMRHLQPGVTDVYAIQKGNDVEEKQKWQEPPGDTAARAVANALSGL